MVQLLIRENNLIYLGLSVLEKITQKNVPSTLHFELGNRA